MNVYDFDNTIYRGESVIDFYFFALKVRPELITLFPKMIYMLARYKLCLISEKELLFEAEKYIKVFFGKLDMQTLIPKFWDKNEKKIKKFYLENKKEDDVILSASADFLLNEICNRLGVKNVVSSRIDIDSGKITQLCFRNNKVDIFKNEFPGTQIDEFYTDSLNDKPMFSLAKHVYIVKGNKVKELIL